MEPRDPRQLRAGDGDRERTANVLRRAAGDGRIDLDELDERLERTFAAKTYAELDAVVADLPGAHQEGVAPGTGMAHLDGSPPLSIVAGFSTQRREGVWEVPRRLTVEPQVADVKLDFREARCDHPVVDVAVKGGAGNLVMLLPPGWAVDTSALSTGWGAVKNTREGAPSPDGTLVRVSGGIGLGALKVREPRFYERRGRR